MKNHFDVVVMGSGLGGLVSAVILAKNGYKVAVLEKNNQIGGNLQVFVRDGKVFDTGVHYIGSLDKGQNLYRYFKYLGIVDDLRLKRLDPDCFDEISFDDYKGSFCIGQGYEVFKRQLLTRFPGEEKALDTYIDKIREITAGFPFYNLETKGAYDVEQLRLNLVEVLDSITGNALLKSVLAGQNMLYAGDVHTPFYVHALSVNSYIQSAWRCVGSCGQIARLLTAQIKKYGGRLFPYHEITGVEVGDGKIVSVKTHSGERFYAEKFISNIDLKQTLRLLGDNVFRKPFVRRITQLEDGISAFSLHVVFKPGAFPYYNKNFYHFSAANGIWDTKAYRIENWPESYMVSFGVEEENPEWATTMSVLAYMRFEEVAPWADSFNTVVKNANRGKSYDNFKREKTQKILAKLEKRFPGIRKAIQSVHTSTPLTYRDYIGNAKGAMYGYEKNAADPLRSIIAPVTRIKNLFLTGQGLNMHGVVGVTIGAVLTCSHILGAEKLMDQIKSAKDEE